MKKRFLCLLTSVALLGTATSIMVSCGGETEVEATYSIRIKADSIKTSYIVGDSVDYSSLSVEILKDGNVVEELKYKGNEVVFTLESIIDTSKVSTNKELKVSVLYKNNTYKDSIAYTVNPIPVVIGGVKIKSGSIDSNYVVGDVKKYEDTLAIEVFDDKNITVDTLLYKDNKDKITIVTDIDTATPTLEKEFKVSVVYKEKTYTAIMNYVVKEYATDITSISIKTGSIKAEYRQNKIETYENLIISLYTGEKEFYKDVKYVDEKENFEIIHGIDTSTIATGVSFEIAYQYNFKKYSAQVNYNVIPALPAISSIAITKDSFKSTYETGVKVDLSTLVINLIKEDTSVLKTVKYVDEKDNFTIITDFDTTAISTGLEFKVSYTYDETVYYATFTYDVIKAATYQVTSIEANKNYAEAIAKKKIGASSATKTDGDFINGNNPIFIGNKNSVNLMPVINVIDLSTMNQTILANMDEDFSFNLTQKGQDVALSLDNYFDNVIDLKSKGLVKFKDTVTGEFSLTIKYKTGSTYSVSYDISVIDGFNVSNAKELTVIDNQLNVYNDFKTKYGIPTTNFENVIIQNNIDIRKSDIPEKLIWDSTRDGKTLDSKVEGTLKDWQFMYFHNLTEGIDKEKDNFNLYGNYHSVSLFNSSTKDGDVTTLDPDNFPMITTINHDGSFNADAKSIDSHTALFGNNHENDEAYKYGFIINDLQSNGNQGIGVDQNINGVKSGGVLFSKNLHDLSFNNSIISKYFTTTVNNGQYTRNNVKGRNPVLSVIDSRVFDTFSTMFFNYGDSTTNVTNSVIKSAGGPLFINQCNEYDKKQFSNISEENRGGSWINIDEKTVLENYVTGQGGWFDIYGATPAIGNLKSFEPLFNLKGRSFLTNKGTATGLLNFIAINMNSNSDAPGALTPGMVGGTNIGGIDYINYRSGKEQMDAGFANVANDQDASFTGAVANTFYGSEYFHSFNGLPIFTSAIENTATSSAPIYSFDTPLTTDGVNFTDIVSPASYITKQMQLGNEQAFKASKYLGINFSLSNRNSDLATKFISDYVGYNGGRSYGVVIGVGD